MRTFNYNIMMAFCNIHCPRKSSRLIVIPTTSVTVLSDAIVPHSSTPILIDRTFAKHRNPLSFETHRWYFLTSTINDTQVYIRKGIFHLGKGVYFYVFILFLLRLGELLFIITMNKKKSSIILDLLHWVKAQGMHNN